LRTWPMTIIETILVFVGIPLAASLLLAAAVYGPTIVHQNRYRPGRAWTHEPVWYVPHPDHVAHGVTPLAGAHATSPAVAAPGRVGGASGEW
jgi:hypothetical protein